MNERVPEHLEKLAYLIGMVREDETLQKMLKSGDKEQVMQVLSRANIGEPDLGELNNDIDLLIELTSSIPFWRFGLVVED